MFWCREQLYLLLLSVYFFLSYLVVHVHDCKRLYCKWLCSRLHLGVYWIAISRTSPALECRFLGLQELQECFLLESSQMYLVLRRFFKLDFLYLVSFLSSYMCISEFSLGSLSLLMYALSVISISMLFRTSILQRLTISRLIHQWLVSWASWFVADNQFGYHLPTAIRWLLLHPQWYLRVYLGL